MAGTDGHAADHLTDPPAADLAAGEFFETVRRLLVAARRDGDAQVAIGDDTAPAHEPVRLRAAAGQRHVETEIVETHAPAGAPVELTVGVMGLTGPAGVLPANYTERVVAQRRAKDMALSEFLDLFNHRALSLFWRAWAKYRLPVAFETGGSTLADPFSRALTSLAGLGVAGEPVADEAMLSMAGMWARRVRSPGALRRLVQGIYDLPIEVVELEGRWVPIAAADRTRLGRPGITGAFARLGHDAVVGGAVWDVGSRVRIRVGPLDFERFQSFFVESGPRKALTDTLGRALGGGTDFTIQLVLARDDVPSLRLDSDALPARLGQTTWLLAEAASRDRDEALLRSGWR